MNLTFAVLNGTKVHEEDGGGFELADPNAQVGKVYTVDLDRKRQQRAWCQSHRTFHTVEVIWGWDEEGQGWLPIKLLDIQAGGGSK